jgi:hypothetical protein
MHTVHVFTDESHFFKREGESFINVFWKVDFNRDLDMYFHKKKKYQHDFDMFKEGVGRLEIRFSRGPAVLKPEHVAYAQVLAAKHIVSNSGINAFGFEDDSQSIRRDQLQFIFNNPTAVDLLVRTKENSAKLSEIGAMAGLTSSSAGYLYGATASVSENHDWLDNYMGEDINFDFYHKIADIHIIENDNVSTPLGEMVIDHRAVEEWMIADINRYKQEVEGAIFPRPYQLVVEDLKKMTNVIYKDSHILKSTREKFGFDCLLLSDREQKTFIQIMPLDAKSQVFKVLGCRHHLSVGKLEVMQAHGYCLDVKINVDKETMERLRAAYKERTQRNVETRVNRTIRRRS